MEQEKLTREEQDGHATEERLPKRVFCVDCVKKINGYPFRFCKEIGSPNLSATNE